ncbi:hypothetical protein DI272_10865 [Streptomyces sp. Act143]|uniref:hypothetical protein n=1 Tax=Streptomyces sp. Act143 TaxID=2200760 RepID=UPI000D682B0E|nr:hypothetical protein [Streptomyces sp. Act143]PWI14604.1 hypothetical protein DI272_10865 [Streptomyces sp. Act143]
MTPEALGPFNRRVRLVVEVRDDQDERDLATHLFEAQGWGVRPVRDGDAVTAEDGYTALVVEIPVHGSRWTARGAAAERLTSLADRRKIDVWVRETKLVPLKSPVPHTTYHVHHKVPEGAGPVLRRLAEQWIAVGGWDVRHTLHLRGEPTEEQRERALAELAARNIGGRPFDREVHDVRVALGPRSDGTPERPRRQALTVAAVLAVALVCLACGGVAGGAATGWRWAALLAPAGLSWPVGAWLTSNAPRPWLVRLACGAAFMAALTCVGYLWGHSQEASLSQQFVWLVVTLGIGFVAFGLWYALSASWFSRNVQWFLPVLAAPLPFVIPWVGTFLHAVYLEDMFGIPADAVHVPFFWQYAVALKPLAVAVICVLTAIATGGWARHFNVAASVAGFFRLMLVLAGIVAVLTTVTLSLGTVERAADRAMDAAAEGRRPAAYYGLRPELVCVHPLAKSIPVINGPVPTTRPVISFQASGDTLWLWDPSPSRGADTPRHALRLRAEDVTLTAAHGTHC